MVGLLCLGSVVVLLMGPPAFFLVRADERRRFAGLPSVARIGFGEISWGRPSDAARPSLAAVAMLLVMAGSTGIFAAGAVLVGALVLELWLGFDAIGLACLLPHLVIVGMILLTVARDDLRRPAVQRIRFDQRGLVLDHLLVGYRLTGSDLGRPVRRPDVALTWDEVVAVDWQAELQQVVVESTSRRAIFGPVDEAVGQWIVAEARSRLAATTDTDSDAERRKLQLLKIAMANRA